MRATTLIAIVGSTLLLTACGIKGSLYMPQIPDPPAQYDAPDTAPDHNKSDLRD